MKVDRLQIWRFRAHYLVSAKHSAAERVKARLDEALTLPLAQTLSTNFSSWFSETDSSIWLIRRLETDVAVNAAWDRDQLSRTISAQMKRTLRAALQDGADQENVRYFPNRAAYLACFLTDVATGMAWNRWYYNSFAGLRMLPTSATLRTAICDQTETGREALLQLANHELQQVLRALTTQDAHRILDSLAESAAPGDEFQCCQAAWGAWKLVDANPFNIAEESQWALDLYLAASRDQKDAAGLTLKGASLALVRLARKLATDSAEHTKQLLCALTGGEMAALYAVAGVSDAEILLPLLRCPPAWVNKVAQGLAARDAGQTANEAATAPGPRNTAFGGVFLLLPILDELPLTESTRDWSHADEVAAISLVRFLLLVKCCGQQSAHHAFYDPLLRDLLLIPPAISLARIREWQSAITTTRLQTLMATLVDHRKSQGVITGDHQILASTTSRGRPVAVLVDCARGHWLLAQRYSPHRPEQLMDALRNSLSQLELNDGVLMCDPSLLAPMRARFPNLKMVSLADEVSQTTNAENQISGILARFDKLSDDLSYLAVPDSFRLSRPFDLALSVAAQSLMRTFAWRLPGFAISNLGYLSRNFLEFTASVEEEPARRVVRLGSPPLRLVLGITGMARQSYRLSWLDERPLALFQET